MSSDAATPCDAVSGRVHLWCNSSAVDVRGVGEQERIHTTGRLVGGEPGHSLAVGGSGVEDLDGNLRSGAIDDWELDDEDISANWIWRFDFPNKWIICDGNDTSVVGGGHGRARGEELDVLNDIAPGVELDVLDFFSYGQIKDD